MGDFFKSISVPDIVAVIVVLVCVFQGVRQGLSKELARTVAVLLALGLGLWSAVPLGDWMATSTRLNTANARALVFTVVAVLILVVFLLLRMVFRILMKVSFNEKIEKPGGALGGIIRGVGFVMIVFLAVNLWPHDYINRKCGEESLVGKWTMKGALRLRPGLVAPREKSDAKADRKALPDEATDRNAATNGVPSHAVP